MACNHDYILITSDYILSNLLTRFCKTDHSYELMIGLTIAGQNNYWDTITIVKNPIAILLLLHFPIAILLR